MINRLLNIFVSDPITYTICIVFLLLGATFSFVLITQALGDPIKDILSSLKIIFKMALKELSLKAGSSGIVDLCIVLLTFVLALTLIVKPSVLSLFGVQENEASVYPLLVFILAIIVFLISLYWASEHEKFEKQFGKE